ncbi:MAG: TrbI/VirB10 family protein [Parvibaculum sp.]
MAGPASPQDQTPPSGKVDPETLVLRAKPRRVTRFRRSVVIGVAAAGSATIFALAFLALEGSSFRLAAPDGGELYPDRKERAEGLAALPESYDDIPKPVPELGAPLPGEFGRPILRREAELGIDNNAGLRPNFVPSAEENDARAERLRLAQQARQAAEADVFFQLKGSSGQGSTSQTRMADAADGTGFETVAASDDRLNLDPERDQNNQQRKLDFLNRGPDRDIYNRHALQESVSAHQLMAGSVIAASLITGLNSDLPGLVVAQITENIFDTVSGRNLLIPQGSRLIGSYDSVVAYGQSRALLVWHRIVMPDGSSIVIDNLPATDAAGYAGVADEVDYHTWALVKGVALATLLGVGTELSFGAEEGDLLRAIRQSTQQNVSQAGQRLTEKNLNIQPTITVRPGWPIRVIVQKDLVLRAYRG